MSNGAKPDTTYKPGRRLGILNPPEEEIKRTAQRPISQVMVNKIKAARDEPTWSQNDLQTLKAASLCKFSHYYRALQTNLKNQGDAPLDSQRIDRDEIVLEIMMGMSVQDAFKKCSGDSVF